MLLSTRRSISYPNPDRSDRPDIPLHIKNLVDALELDVVYVQGTDAARLAAAHLAGVIWKTTDTGLFWWDTGAVWVQIGATASDVHKIGTQAARLASATLAAGTLWAETDTGKVYRTDGLGNAAGNWTLVSAAAGAELDYAQITANITGIAVTTEGTASTVIAGNSITYDGTKLRIDAEIFFNTISAAHTTTFVCFRDATAIGQKKFVVAVNGVLLAKPTWFDTPSAAAHTYTVKAFVDANTSDIQAGAGGAGALYPNFLRVTKA